jgi:hypothetical protein
MVYPFMYLLIDFFFFFKYYSTKYNNIILTPYICAYQTVHNSEEADAPLVGHDERGASIDLNPSNKEFLNKRKSNRVSVLSRKSLTPRSLAQKTERKRKRAELKKLRSSLPAHDADGNPNPVSIRMWNVSPVIHIHHHGKAFFRFIYFADRALIFSVFLF